MKIPTTMKAVVVTSGVPLKEPCSLQDAERAVPVPGPKDLLVKIEAISVNPIDTKVRSAQTSGGSDVLGWDAAGTVVAIGGAVARFRPGDEIYYAGSIDRAGGNAEYQVVDERVAASKPHSLTVMMESACASVWLWVLTDAQ